MPIYFDLDDTGAAADAAARAFVVKALPALGGASVSTPSALVMTPAGEVVAELDPYQGSAEFLKGLQAALRARPEFARDSTQEEALTDPVDRATLALDLCNLVGAKKILESAEGPSARYLAGHIARLTGDHAAMEEEFARVDSVELADDMRAERAQAAWSKRDLATLLRSTEKFPAASKRCTEVLYLRGLALYHSGKVEKALALWHEIVLNHPEDAWVYRSDWAYTETKAGFSVGGLSAGGPAGCSPLGRIGYLGRKNPDLERR